MLLIPANKDFIGKSLLGVALVFSAILQSRGIENYHLFIFPIVILALFLILRNQQLKLLALCSLIWLFASFWVFPARFFNQDNGNILISQLENDQSGLLLRSWLREIKKHPGYFISLNKRFSSNEQIRSWLTRRPSTAFLVTGNAAWLKVVFPAQSKLAELLTEDLQNLSVDAEDPQVLNTHKLAIALVPEEIELAREPQELSAGLLAQMSLALSSVRTDISLKQELTKRRLAAEKARNIWGYWKSGTARSWAFFTEATLELIELLQAPDSSELLCPSLEKKFVAAAKLASSRNRPPNIASYIYNNAAVAKIICGGEALKSKNLLNNALAVSKELRSKRIAQINLEAVRNF